MAAIIGMDDDAVRDVCEETSAIGVAEAVNFNSPGQVVIAGHKKAIDHTIVRAEELGARRAILLPVSVPSHSSLMIGAGEKLAEALGYGRFFVAGDSGHQCDGCNTVHGYATTYDRALRSKCIDPCNGSPRSTRCLQRRRLGSRVRPRQSSCGTVAAHQSRYSRCNNRLTGRLQKALQA